MYPLEFYTAAVDFQKVILCINAPATHVRLFNYIEHSLSN